MAKLAAPHIARQCTLPASPISAALSKTAVIMVR
jgi:hypothetical protein